MNIFSESLSWLIKFAMVIQLLSSYFSPETLELIRTQ